MCGGPRNMILLCMGYGVVVCSLRCGWRDDALGPSPQSPRDIEENKEGGRMCQAAGDAASDRAVSHASIARLRSNPQW